LFLGLLEQSAWGGLRRVVQRVFPLKVSTPRELELMTVDKVTAGPSPSMNGLASRIIAFDMHRKLEIKFK